LGMIPSNSHPIPIIQNGGRWDHDQFIHSPFTALVAYDLPTVFSWDFPPKFPMSDMICPCPMSHELISRLLPSTINPYQPHQPSFISIFGFPIASHYPLVI
jgi:hypothetical protein